MAGKIKHTDMSTALQITTTDRPNDAPKADVAGKPKSADQDVAAKLPPGKETITIEDSEFEAGVPRVTKQKKTAVFELIGTRTMGQVPTENISKALND